MRLSYLLSLATLLPLAASCGDDGHTHDPDAMVGIDALVGPDADPGAAPTTYAFPSRFVAGASSVAYSGQVFRHTLVSEISAYIGRLTAAVGTTPPADGDIEAALLFYFDFDGSTGAAAALTIATTPPLLQETYGDISGGADLRSKVAGNDASTDHLAWNDPGSFTGWSEGGTATETPTKLVEYWIATLDDLAFQRLTTPALDPEGNPVSRVYLTAAGQDLQQLLQEFLLGSITLSQALDDYLDDATPAKGLLASNVPADGDAYSPLEHAWDEAFGYFGAARDYGDYTDDEIAAAGGRADYQGVHDSDGDQRIDLLAEYNTGTAVNCAKRDRGSAATAPTDFTQQAFDAFIAGRHLIHTTVGELSADQLDELRGHRDTVQAAWEKCIAATVVHYINDVVADMDAMGTQDYSFADHAKHWSELKGFALGLQFNPRSPLLQGTLFADLHGYLGDAPVLAPAGATALATYRAGLLSARALMATAYGFDAANAEGW